MLSWYCFSTSWPERFSIVPVAIDVQEYRRIGRAISATPTILFMAMISKAKGAIDLLKAVPLVQREFPESEFVFAGTTVHTERNLRGLSGDPHDGEVLQELLERLEQGGINTENFFSLDQPLYEIVEGESEKETVAPLFSIPEILDKVLEIGRRGVSIKRFKGLGEMNPDQLWETTMDPEKRTMLQVNIEDAEEADEIFTILMGSKVEPRKEFIEKYAKSVRWIDV